MKIIDEFKSFAIKGNAIDLAVGVVIGAAFGKIVSSFVSDIITPALSVITGGIDFSDKIITLKQATEEASAITINYGAFLTVILDFIIIAWVIFIVIRTMNRMHRREEAKPTTPPKTAEEVLLLREIRDTLKK